MFRRVLPLLLLTGSLALAKEPLRLQATPYLSGLEQPTSFADDGSGRHFVTEQKGRIRLAINGNLRREPYLDLSDRVKEGGECGLLCIAFHPDFATNGRFYVNYTTEQRGKLETVISEFRTTSARLRADTATERVLLRFDQPYANHNGGQLAFGPDGMLYIAVGDGGSGGDPHNAGQDLSTWLGKILRIDVNVEGEGTAYRVPADNPFVDRKGARPEIWAWGLRNPWRFSFDRKTGLLWAADVGQNKWEEIDIIEKGGNYGWSAREGAHDFKPERAALPLAELKEPVKEYGREEGQSVTGGYVYRGKRYPAIDGLYVYGDFASRRLWVLQCEGAGKPVTYSAEVARLPFNISAFGEDHEGELYVLDYLDGRVHRLSPPAAATR